MKQEEEKCCGNCCWFCFEDTDGNGQCMRHGIDGMPYGEFRNCGTLPCWDYESREEMRHHMAVLLTDIRWDEDTEFIRYAPDGDEATAAKKFAYQYMKMFSKL